MQTRWFLSKFYTDATLDMLVPVCTAYGGKWLCPRLPETTDGWAIVLMLTSPQQMEAAKQDSRVTVLPLPFDPSPLPQQVTDTYASWGATTGMSFGALLSKLSETEPIFGQDLS